MSGTSQPMAMRRAYLRQPSVMPSWREEAAAQRESATKRAAVQRSIRQGLRAAGLCTQCGRDVVTGRSLCAVHAAISASRTRAVYYERKANGWCVKCGGNKEPWRRQKVRCQSCNEEAVRRNRQCCAIRKRVVGTALEENSGQHAAGAFIAAAGTAGQNSEAVQ